MDFTITMGFAFALLVYLLSIVLLCCAAVSLIVMIVRIYRYFRFPEEYRTTLKQSVIRALCWLLGFLVLYGACVLVYSSIPVDW